MLSLLIKYICISKKMHLQQRVNGSCCWYMLVISSVSEYKLVFHVLSKGMHKNVLMKNLINHVH
jgi:hypothetical protein